MAYSPSMDRPESPKRLTPSQAAEHLGVSVRTVSRLADRGLLTAHHLPGSRHRRYDIVEVSALAGESA